MSSSRTENFYTQTDSSSTGVSKVDEMVKKIREDRKAKAAPNTPESRGFWTDNTRLH